MVSTLRLRLLFGTVLILFLVALAPTGLGADHAWGPYHWRKTSSNPVALTLGDNVSAIWYTHFAEAVQDWDASNVLALSIVPGGTTPRACKPKGGKIEVCDASYGFNGWLGLARIWVSGDHITSASTQVNNTYMIDNGALYGYDTPEWRQFVMCQEIGHVFGLDHVDENFDNENVGTCMDYTDNPAGGGSEPANTSPYAHDYQELGVIYSHIDATGGGGGGGRGGGAGGAPQGRPTPVDQDDLGDLIRSHGRLALFRLNLGNGNFIFTFVIRA